MDDVVGAVKIHDGLFLGDELAAQDLELVISNKITHIVNCSGRETANHWESIGVVYLTYFWLDSDQQVILDSHDIVASEAAAFIEEALQNCESVLIHGVNGQSRSCTILLAFLMRKYRWTLRKALEFLNSRKPCTRLRGSFLDQLAAYERRLILVSKTRFSTDWDDATIANRAHNDPELIVRNTYVNATALGTLNLPRSAVAHRGPRLRWSDSGSSEHDRRVELLETGPHQAADALAQRSADGSWKNLRPIIKRPPGQAAPPGATKTASGNSPSNDSGGSQSRPTTASSEIDGEERAASARVPRDVGAGQRVKENVKHDDDEQRSLYGSLRRTPSFDARERRDERREERREDRRAASPHSSLGRVPGNPRNSIDLERVRRGLPLQRASSPSVRDRSPARDETHDRFRRNPSPSRSHLEHSLPPSAQQAPRLGLSVLVGRPLPTRGAGSGTMSQFRNGPVRVSHTDATLPRATQRPSTAPLAGHDPRSQPPPGSWLRRPISPLQRPASPSAGDRGLGTPAPKRSVTGHVRRAPSPTPAFNRVQGGGPGRPRWR